MTTTNLVYIHIHENFIRTISQKYRQGMKLMPKYVSTRHLAHRGPVATGHIDVKIVLLVKWRQSRLPFMPLEQVTPLLPHPLQPHLDYFLVIGLQAQKSEDSELS
jgi:hypothetical protein